MALKKVLMDNEKEGVCIQSLQHSFNLLKFNGYEVSEHFIQNVFVNSELLHWDNTLLVLYVIHVF